MALPSGTYRAPQGYSAPNPASRMSLLRKDAESEDRLKSKGHKQRLNEAMAARGYLAKGQGTRAREGDDLSQSSAASPAMQSGP